MKSIAWVTDSTCTIDPDFAKENHIYIVPLRLIFGNETYKETIDITSEEVYEKLKIFEKAGSSQPPIGEFIELYEYLKDKYDEIIAIHCSSALSGTFHNSIQAAEIAETSVVGIDSQAGAFPFREMIMHGIKLQHEGLSAQEIKESIQPMIDNTKFFLIPANLQQLHRSGRASGTQLLISNLLKINLIIRFDEGKVLVDEKIRTFKKAKQRLIEHLKTDIEKIKTVCVMHANNITVAQEIKQEIATDHPNIKIEIMTFIPVVGILAGEGTIGLSWIKNY
ncbi:DegV family protein [Paenibacillus glacialis]|uniref:Fatty acid-binding protein DegV n=1 Tax=Paenibacillus glacialis TaxID=494026 RepID=A0A168K3M2_9BACL|nr:DegV family protein [Paenibacillus glacialis]OAB41491.1 fatty acid-binding protein DegV [Paenibacillus glacialis]